MRSDFLRSLVPPLILGICALPLPVFAQIELDVADADAEMIEAEAEAPAHPLVERSPFLPAGFEPNERANSRAAERNRAGPIAQRFEFRGYYQLNGEYRFLVREKNQSSGRWVRLNDPDAAYLVENFDEATGEIRLSDGGQTETIALIQLDTNAAPMPVSGQPPAASPTNPGNNPNNVADANNRRARPIPPGATPTPPRPAAQRRTPPPPPQWLQNRLAERGVDAAAITAEIEKGPPNFIPPPPPTELPPGVPNSGNSDGGRPDFPDPSEMGSPPSGTPPGLPPGMSIPEAPNFTPPPPPGAG